MAQVDPHMFVRIISAIPEGPMHLTPAKTAPRGLIMSILQASNGLTGLLAGKQLSDHFTLGMQHSGNAVLYKLARLCWGR